MPVIRHKQNQYLSEISQNNNLFVFSGQVSSGNTIGDQAEGIFTQLNNLLAEVGLTQQNILYANVFLTDMNDYDEFNRHWANWIGLEHNQVPSRSAIQVVFLANPEWRVEVQITAAR
jgi:enamine deaminase RidA (YjgF/YER057c/UK114 family)